MVSRFCVSIRVRHPKRAAARAASIPAWPLPTIRTSTGSGSVNIFQNSARRFGQKMGEIVDLPVAVYRRANDNQIWSEFSQELPTSSAGGDRFGRVRCDRDCDELPFPRGD